jgi:hypothetical protein
MNQKFDPKEVSDQLELPSGEIIVLLDRLGKGGQYSKEEQARNVLRVDADGHVIWQVRSSFDAEGSPFTRLHTDAGGLVAYRWDGGSYTIDIGSGIATPRILER